MCTWKTYGLYLCQSLTGPQKIIGIAGPTWKNSSVEHCITRVKSHPPQFSVSRATFVKDIQGMILLPFYSSPQCSVPGGYFSSQGILVQVGNRDKRQMCSQNIVRGVKAQVFSSPSVKTSKATQKI